MQLLLPGLFLLILGAGNIAVGLYKSNQYKLVLDELSADSTPVLVNASPLRRIQLAEQTASRLYQRKNKARARLDFYELITFGGQVFVALSLIFLTASSGLKYLRGRSSEPKLDEHTHLNPEPDALSANFND